MPLQVHENALLLTNPDPPEWIGNTTPPSPRGRVQRFSPASRRRLLRLLSTLRYSELGPCSFVTLTFHRTPAHWRDVFQNWLREVRRAGGRYLWRVEVQKRGAPHWHLLLWLEPEQLARLRERWHELAAHGSRAHRRYGWHESKVESYRQAASYVSKYVAKEDAVEWKILDGCRHWGASRDLPRDPVGVADITEREFYALRRLARRLIRSRNRSRRRRGLSPRSVHLFCTEATGRAAAAWLGIELEPPPPPRARPRAPDRGAARRPRGNAGDLGALLRATAGAMLRTG